MIHTPGKNPDYHQNLTDSSLVLKTRLTHGPEYLISRTFADNQLSCQNYEEQLNK